MLSNASRCLLQSLTAFIERLFMIAEVSPALDQLLMTADTVGGVWTYALELSRALQAYEVEVALATMGAPLGPSQREAAARLPNVTVYESEYKLEWMQEPWTDVEEAGAWLLDLEARLQPDLVHLNNFAHGALSWERPTLVVGHSCVFSWFEAVEGEVPGPGWARYHEAVSRGLQAADRVTAPTEAMLNALRQHYGPVGEGQVVYNGRAPTDFPPHEKEPYVLAAGRLWDPAKNVAALEQVASTLPWPVRVAGPCCSPEGEQVDFERMEVLGRLSPGALAEEMGHASVFVLPARYEPFGLTALEAALAGCALVLGDIPSLREVWGGAAQYVPPDDGGGLRDALRRLTDDDDYRRQMRQRARQRARGYTPERMVTSYLRLYRQLLAETPRPAPAELKLHTPPRL